MSFLYFASTTGGAIVLKVVALTKALLLALADSVEVQVTP